MAGNRTQTVFGFDCALDWRPTVFVNEIPLSRVCSVCGLVPSRLALLSCRHLLCQPCYDRCVVNGSRCCLDGEDVQCDDVGWSSYSTDRLLGRKIQCWNTSSGCDAVGPASDILEHLSKYCQYHLVTCPRCERIISHKDVVDHIESDLCTQTSMVGSQIAASMEPEVKQITSALGQLDAKLSSLQTSVQDYFTRIGDCMERSTSRMTLDSPVAESIQGLDNTLKEIMQLSRQAVVEIGGAQDMLKNNIAAIMVSLQQVNTTVSELKASQNHTSAERTTEELESCTSIKCESDSVANKSMEELKKIREKLERVEEMIECIEMKPASQGYMHIDSKQGFQEPFLKLPLNKKLYSAEDVEFSIEPLSDYKEFDKVIIYAKRPDYLHGYLIYPAVGMEKKGDDKSLYFVLQICKGDYDELLTWPIKKRFLLWLLHPTDPVNTECICMNTAPTNREEYRRPSEARNSPLWSCKGVNIGFLEECGYIKDDKVSFRLEVLP